YSPNCDFGLRDNELIGLINTIALFHDLGKYTSYFQNYLFKRQPIDRTLKQHSRIGGFAAYNYLKEKNERQALLALYLIFLHHSQLIDPRRINEQLNGDLQRIIHYQQIDLLKHAHEIEQELEISGLKRLTEYPDEKTIRRG